MSNSPSASSVNAGSPVAQPASWPAQIRLDLSLVFEVPDQEALDYLRNPTGGASLGFIADLFDYLNMEMQQGAKSINGLTPEDVRKHFQQFIP